MTTSKRVGGEQSRRESGRWVVPLLLTALVSAFVFLSAPAPALAPSSSWSALDEDNSAPAALWSDGDTLWVADYWDQYVYAYDLATGDRVSAHDIDVWGEGLYPSGLWGDEETLWVLDYTGGLSAYSLATGARDATQDIAAVGSGVGLWSDEATLWVTDHAARTLKAYDFSGQRLLEQDVATLSAAGNEAPAGVWGDGETVWVADSADAKLYAYDLATGEPVPAWDLDTLASGSAMPIGVWSDGETVWVADFSEATVHAYALPGAEAGSVSEGSEDLPDGRLATPGVVVVGDSVTGTIDPAGDRDGYAVALAAGTTYRIDLEGAATGQGTLADPLLRWLRDGTGSGIGGTRDDNGGEGLNARQVFTPEGSGTYYISVTGHGTGTYTLSVTEQPAAADPPPSNDARLGSLELSGIVLDAFSSAVTDYSVTVSHELAATTVSALAVDAGASVSVSPVDADSEAPGHQVALAAAATTVISVTVTAADGSVQATTVRVSRAAPPSNDARLGSLELSGIILDAFSSAVTDYSVTVSHELAATTVTALAADAGASVSVSPGDADPEAPGHQVALAPGTTTVITVSVTAADGTVQSTTVRVTPPSSDARLGSLELSGIVLDAFSSAVTDYSVIVSHELATATVTVTALAADAGATVGITPGDAAPEAPGHQVALAPGTTTVITVSVTAADGTVQATTVRVSRAAPPSNDARLGSLELSGIVLDAFSSAVTDYSVIVSHELATVTVTALAADAGATVGITPGDADAEAPGHQVALAPGTTTVITVSVTAADGTVQATTVRVSRAAPPSSDARLGSLELSGIVLDAFSSAVTDYSVTVDHTVAEATVAATLADAGATVSITPGDADPEAPGHQVALAPGTTTVITVSVTAADGTVQATTVRVSRAAPPSNDARLGSLQLSGIALDAFSSAVTDYSVTVDHTVAEATVATTLADAGATVSITPGDADPEAPGHQVDLAPGTTTVITVSVTAADGTVQATTVRVSRAAPPSSDARLGSLELSGIALDAFSSAVTDYSVTVDHTVAEATVAATLADAGATVSITPGDADPEAPGHQVDLTAGATTVITLTVTAADGTVQATTVRITRAAPPSSGTRLGSLQLSGIALDAFSSEVTDYSVTANRAMTTVSATPADAGASISITPADAYPDPIDSGHQVALATDAITVISITVTAADGSVQATTVRVTHAAAVVAALPAEMTRHSLLNTLRDRQITSVEDFVAELPPLHKRHVAFVYRSEALFKEFISGDFPRVISWGADARFVFSWSTDPASPGHAFVEFLKPLRDRWIAGVIDFSGPTPALREPATCAGCHGQLHKPLWGQYTAWLGTEGEGANTAYPASPEIIANTLQVVESTDPRIAPLELRPYSRFGGLRTIPFPNGNWMPVPREIGAVFAWRHDEVLFGEVRARANYAEIARSVVCAGRHGYGRKLKAYFEPGEHHLSVLSDSGRLIQGSELSQGGLYGAGYVSGGHGFAFLILHDLWQREPRVTAALAGHEAKLQAAHFEHFGTPGQAVLNARTHSMHSGSDPITAPGALNAVMTKLAPRACAALGGDMPRLASGAASEQIAVLGFSLVDAAGQVVEPLAEGQLVDLRGLAGTVAGIRAEVAGGAKVGHVELGLTGVRSGVRLAQTVTAAPYVLDLPTALAVEEYSVSATAVPTPAGDGAAAPGLSLRFSTIVGSAALHAAWTHTPRAVWAAGERLWAVDAAAGAVYAYALADGSPVGEAIPLAADNGDPVGLWGDGTTLWVADRTAVRLFAYAVADGSPVGEAIPLATDNGDPVGLWGDGTTLWVADRTAARLFAYALADGSRLSEQDVGLAAEADPVGLWADGVHLWVADGATGTLVAYDVADWSRAAHRDVRTGVAGRETAPVLVWSDGTTIWVADPVSGRLRPFSLPARPDDASLAALYLSGIPIGPFAPATLDYTAYVAHRVATTTVTAWARVGTAAVVITPPDADTTAPGHQVTLAAGSATPITVTVTDQATTRTTTVTVHRAAATASTDATLSGLSLSGLDVGPFTSGTLAYAAENTAALATTTVTAAPTDSGAQVVIDPADADPDAPGHQVALRGGSVTIAVTVTAADRTTVQRYIVVVTTSTDATLSGLSLSGLDVGPFRSGTLAYAVENTAALATTTVTAAPTDSGARVAIEPADADPEAPGHQVALRGGSVTIAVTVTAADRATVQRYTVVVTTSTDAALSGLSLSGLNIGPFRSAWLTYAAENADGIALTTVAATPTDGGTQVAILPADADPDAPGHQVALGAESVTIAVTVTAADRATVQRYTVVVKPPIARLSALTLSGMALDFRPSVTTYHVFLPSDTSVTTVTATPAEDGASVAFNPATDADTATPGHQVTLPVHGLILVVTVTSAGRAAQRSYTVQISPERLDGNLRLVDGVSPLEGRVEVFLNDEWGTVCDDLFAEVDAAVVCRQLGYTEGAAVGWFAAGSGPIHLDNVGCAGTEERLIDCPYHDSPNCLHVEDVGVLCGPPEHFDGNLRLVDGASPLEGRVEVFLDGEWGTVCDDLFAEVDATVVCRQLGYTGGVPYTGGLPYDPGPGSGPIHLDDVGCAGTESRLIDCAYDDSPNCFHFEDVGVLCSPPVDNVRLSALVLSGVDIGGFDSATLAYTASVENATAQTTVTAAPAHSGARVVIDPGDADPDVPGHQIALSVGITTIALTVTDRSGTVRSYVVQVERAAGGDTLSGLSLSGLNIGTFASAWLTYAVENADGIALTTVAATPTDGGAQVAIEPADADPEAPGHQVALGAESVIIAVTVTAADRATVQRYTVVVQPPIARLSALTLSGMALDFRPSVTAYRVFLPSDTSVTTVTATPAEDGASVAFNPATDADTATPGHQVTLPVHGLFLVVTVTAADRSTQRSYTVQTAQRPFDGNLRLVDGANPSEGRVEVFLDGEWGTVCDDYFTEVDATVVCRQLGYTEGQVSSDMKAGSGRIHLDNVDCAGTEERLIDCPHHNSGNCFHFEDVVVSCTRP